MAGISNPLWQLFRLALSVPYKQGRDPDAKNGKQKGGDLEGGGGGKLPYKSDGEARRSFYGLKMQFWYLLKCSFFKRLQL